MMPSRSTLQLTRSLPAMVLGIVSMVSALALPAQGSAARAPRAIATNSAASGTAVTALVGATVIDVVSGARLPDHVVVFAGGRIREVVPRAGWRAARGVTIVQVAGRFVIPGLWDMHVEQALPLWDRAVVDSNAAFFHPLFLAYGVTGVRDVAGPLSVVRSWRDAIERGERVGPRIVFTGPKLGMGAVAPGAPFPLTSSGDVDASVLALKRGGAVGAYLLNLEESLLPALQSSIARHGIALEGNVPLTTSLRRQVEMGQRVVDHMDGILVSGSTEEEEVRSTLRLLDAPTWWARWGWKLGIMKRPEFPSALALEHFSEARAESTYVQLAARHVYQVPTLRLLGVLNRSSDSAVRLPPEPLELRPPRHPSGGWPAEPVSRDHPLARVQTRLLWSVGAMHRAGVPILAGSDAPNLYAAPGLALHDELALLVRAGLTPLEAIRSATWRPAQYLGATDSLGTVAPGRVADLLVLAGDPTVDIANSRRLEIVVVRGHVYDSAAIQRMRRDATDIAREIERYWKQKQADRK